MQSKILKLPETVINQIAAGEVVENPASIVKELVENSLDAGARRIDIKIERGGFEKIVIEDDGCGMSREEALLSLERHATSKIRCIEDLDTLSTMGFRGEALAAISSVSRFEMRTSNGKATRLVVEGGNVVTELCARNQGTTLEVRDLFYNVPARKKFQKSQSASQAAILRVVETLALAHPEIAFSLNDQVFAPTTLEKRLERIVGKYEHLVRGQGIFGYIASPLQAAVNRTGQYLYINKRPLFSPLISKAVKEAVGTRIAESMHPRFVLFLEMAPDRIDVNVHPQKREVRFREEGAIFRKVKEAVEKAFVPVHEFSEPLVFTTPEVESFSMNFPTFACKAEERQLDHWTMPEQPLAVFGKFLLLQKQKLVIVDLKAVSSRILFENLQTEKKAITPLLWPLEIPILPGDEEKISQLEQLGVEYRILNKTLVVDALPSFLEAASFPAFYAEWKGGKSLKETTSRFSRSQTKTFSLQQAWALWQELQKCQDRIYDPLGNPLFIELDEERLTQLLHRK